MTIVALAIDTSHNLSNEIVDVETPEEAVEKFSKFLEFTDGEQIIEIVCTVIGVDSEFTQRVEQLFYAEFQHRFVDGYNWVAAQDMRQA